LIANTGSQALQVLDREIAPLYEHAAAAALEGLPAGATFDAYQRAMEPWNRLEQGLRTSHSAMVVMQAALRAWEAGSDASEADYGQALACAVEGFQAVTEASRTLGIDLKPEILEFITLAGKAAGACDGQ
jgi:hypothetical protein